MSYRIARRSDVMSLYVSLNGVILLPMQGVPAVKWTIRWSSTEGNPIGLRWPMRHPSPQHSALRYPQHNLASRMPRGDQLLRFLRLLQRKDITHKHLHFPGVNQRRHLLQLLGVRL